MPSVSWIRASLTIPVIVAVLLIGGGGEKKTLRLVAQYADSCNLFAREDLAHKLDVIKQHCEDVGRDYDEIQKTVMYRFDLGERGERVGAILDDLRGLAEQGVAVGHGGLRNAWDLKQFEVFAKEIVPAAESF